jgi:PAS domain S-box-containing protein
MQNSNKKQELDFRALFESCPGLYLVLSPELLVLAVSDAYSNAILKKREEIVGEKFSDVFRSNFEEPNIETTSEIIESLHEVLRTKVSNRMAVIRHDILNPEGKVEERYWSPRNKPVLNKNNEIIYIIHRVEDVTILVGLQKEQISNEHITDDLQLHALELSSELIHVNKELLKSNADIMLLNSVLEAGIIDRTTQLEILNNSISDYKFALDESSIVAVTDQKGIIQFVNENFCKISKYKQEEIIGKDHRIINSGYHSKEFIRNLWVTIASGNIWKGEMRNKAKDGTYYWVDTTIVPFLNKDRKPYKYLAIRIDITQRKVNEQELILNEEKYQDLFENSIVAMFVTDLATQKTNYANEIGVKLLGYKSKQDFKTNFDLSKHIFKNIAFRKIINKLFKEGSIKNVIIKIKKLDGTFFWVRLFAKVNSNKNYVQSAIMDISEQMRSQVDLEVLVKERTLELTESLKREKVLNEMKTDFVSLVSHEFRTPLSSILSSTSLIEMHANSGNQDKMLKHTKRIAASVSDLTDILDDFLSSAQFENQQIKDESLLFDLPVLVKNTLEEVEGMLYEKNQRVTYFHEGDTFIEQCEKTIKNILLNLLSNAIKYSHSNHEIEVTTSVKNMQVLLAVKDTGIGIPFADQNKLFTDFFRANNVENIQGTGLGLSIVQKYVKMIQGTIKFISKQNEGSTFSVEFPQKSSNK